MGAARALQRGARSRGRFADGGVHALAQRDVDPLRRVQRTHVGATPRRRQSRRARPPPPTRAEIRKGPLGARRPCAGPPPERPRRRRSGGRGVPRPDVHRHPRALAAARAAAGNRRGRRVDARRPPGRLLARPRPRRHSRGAGAARRRRGVRGHGDARLFHYSHGRRGGAGGASGAVVRGARRPRVGRRQGADTTCRGAAAEGSRRLGSFALALRRRRAHGRAPRSVLQRRPGALRRPPHPELLAPARLEPPRFKSLDGRRPGRRRRDGGRA
mmetsp:Transcript_3417/g.11996  ORF Transcript_3417/g.11996 Transcript_3417/m.11996 type:complete len:272 (-) Transcript_3417:113-928(-)